MKYMLMMSAPSGGPYQITSWPEADVQRHLAYMSALARSMSEAGELVAAEALTAPDQARHVRAGKQGEPVTDGVFPETKEFLAGYWLVDVDRPERAFELAAQASRAPGAGGAPLNMSIEVRRVMSGCAGSSVDDR